MKKGLILKVLVIGFIASNLNEILYAQQVFKQPSVEALKEFREASYQVLKEGVAPTPKKAIAVLRYLDMVSKGVIKEDLELTKILAIKGGAKLGVKSLIDAGIDVMVENMKEDGIIKPGGVFDEHVVKLSMQTAKNAVFFDVKGQLIDSAFTIAESWQDTANVLEQLPPLEKLPPEQQVYMEDLYTAKELMNGNLWMKAKALGMAFEEGIKRITNLSTRQAVEFPNILPTSLSTIPISPELAKKLAYEKPTFDSSQLSERNPQQLLTPVNISFTTTFDGLFTQAADSPGSQGGNHSGTITNGIRIGAGSRPGDFTGSFSGRTIGESGYTPATHTNVPFSGTSVGTATARGFQEGDLKGSMTVTVPAGTQTAAVSGSITINTDGSLSMPSYSGPVTVVATGEKVGTMSGSWSQ